MKPCAARHDLERDGNKQKALPKKVNIRYQCTGKLHQPVDCRSRIIRRNLINKTGRTRTNDSEPVDVAVPPHDLEGAMAISQKPYEKNYSLYVQTRYTNLFIVDPESPDET